MSLSEALAREYTEALNRAVAAEVKLAKYESVVAAAKVRAEYGHSPACPTTAAIADCRCGLHALRSALSALEPGKEEKPTGEGEKV